MCRRGRLNAKLRCFCVDFGFLFCNGHALRVNLGILGLERGSVSLSQNQALRLWCKGMVHEFFWLCVAIFAI